MLARISVIATLALVLSIDAQGQQDALPGSRGGAARGPMQELAEVRNKGGSDAWDDEVKAILLRAYDTDRSGKIDTQSELNAIPCEIWQFLHRQIAAADKQSGLAWTYGFKPGDYSYVGEDLGIATKLRSAAFQRIKNCGVDTGS